jgi:hypothetical protein
MTDIERDAIELKKILSEQKIAGLISDFDVQIFFSDGVQSLYVYVLPCPIIFDMQITFALN